MIAQIRNRLASRTDGDRSRIPWLDVKEFRAFTRKQKRNFAMDLVEHLTNLRHDVLLLLECLGFLLSLLMASTLLVQRSVMVDEVITSSALSLTSVLHCSKLDLILYRSGSVSVTLALVEAAWLLSVLISACARFA